MRYECKNNIQNNYLENVLKNRGVSNIKEYLNPSSKDENSYYLLDNIVIAAELLLSEIKNDATILIVVDCDCDGYTSAAMLWNYLKEYNSSIDLNYIIHDGKQHGLEDLIDKIESSSFHYDLVIIPDAGR